MKLPAPFDRTQSSKMSAALTKKQQKALAFKSKQKAKRRGEGDGQVEDVPEQDLLADDEEPTVTASEKAEAEAKPAASEQKADKNVHLREGESEKKKGKRKKTAWDDEEEDDAEDGEKASKKSKKDVQQRFILFVGNLGFKTTKDRIEAVFRQALGASSLEDTVTNQLMSVVGETPSVRLLTNKAKPGSTAGPTSRGIAFVEFPNSTLLQQALKLHHTQLDGRRINVELTAGGGGSGQARKDKIEARKGRLGEQREKKAEKEREEGAAAVENSVPQVHAAGGQEGEVKMRGGRRIKAKPKAGSDVSHSLSCDRQTRVLIRDRPLDLDGVIETRLAEAPTLAEETGEEEVTVHLAVDPSGNRPAPMP